MLKRKYSGARLDLAMCASKHLERIKTEMLALDPNTISNWWVRRTITYAYEINHQHHPQRTDVRKVGNHLEYRIVVTQIIDAPLFWSSPAKRKELQTIINDHFATLPSITALGFDIKIYNIKRYVTEYVITGKIKLEG